MELIAIALARVVAFLEVQGLDPIGKASFPAALKSVADRYCFLKTPQSLADIDFAKGVEFGVGKLGEINIDKMTIYGNGLFVDTRSSTDDADRVLEDFLGFVTRQFGASVKPSRRNLVSHIIFRSSLRLALLNPLLEPFAARFTSVVSRELGQPVQYETTAFVLGPDFSQIKLEPIPFTLERRVQVPFSDNAYFSSAPVHTKEHLEILRDIEASLSAS